MEIAAQRDTGAPGPRPVNASVEDPLPVSPDVELVASVATGVVLVVVEDAAVVVVVDVVELVVDVLVVVVVVVEDAVVAAGSGVTEQQGGCRFAGICSRSVVPPEAYDQYACTVNEPGLPMQETGKLIV